MYKIGKNGSSHIKEKGSYFQEKTEKNAVDSKELWEVLKSIGTKIKQSKSIKNCFEKK